MERIKVQAENEKSPARKGWENLLCLGIGEVIEVVTIKKGSGKKTTFLMNWKELTGYSGGGDYRPSYKNEECDKQLGGTTIVLKELRRLSRFDKNEFAVSLSKLFNFFDADFRCWVYLNDDEGLEINNELKYESVKSQFEWNFPEFLEDIGIEYEIKQKIYGKIISTEKPLRPGFRGITFFANGRLVNRPEFFGVSESSHVFSYLTGWLNVDFVDDMEEDVISTNRQSLNWELSEISDLRKLLAQSLRYIERDWRLKRKESREKAIAERGKVDIQEWYQTLPQDILSDTSKLISAIIEDSELPGDIQAEIVERVYKLIPEYPYYHWRHLHEDIRDASEEGYRKEDYYKAFSEAVKRYINKVRKKSQSTEKSDFSMVSDVFGKNILRVAKKYKRPNGDDFSSQTKDNIEQGQKFLSMGIVAGARNPLSHEEITDLRDSELFSEEDCLDALSLLSHLFRRLDNACLENDEAKQD